MLAKSLNNPKTAPSRENFAAYPASWYLFCRSEDLRVAPLSKRMLGRQLVAFRAASGRIAVLDAHCSHMNADLGCGRIVGETVQCPFHGWRYGTDGTCSHIPNASEIPSFARQRTYAVTERHGFIFIFNGREPLFALPFILGENPDDFVAGEPFRYDTDTTWYMNAAHAFDRQHFESVHDRKLLAAPAIDCPAPFARRNSYHAEVVGTTIFDRLLRRFAGRTVYITLTIWGGTFAVITGEFERVRSAFLMSMLPLENGHTLCEGIVLARRGAVPLLDVMSLRARRLFTHGYLADEARRLRGTRYNPASLTEHDADMTDYFNWVVSLPQQPTLNKEKQNEGAQSVIAVTHRDNVSLVSTATTARGPRA